MDFLYTLMHQNSLLELSIDTDRRLDKKRVFWSIVVELTQRQSGLTPLLDAKLLSLNLR